MGSSDAENPTSPELVEALKEPVISKLVVSLGDAALAFAVKQEVLRSLEERVARFQDEVISTNLDTAESWNATLIFLEDLRKLLGMDNAR